MFGKEPESTRPLQRVEVDNTPLDILVIDEATRYRAATPYEGVASAIAEAQSMGLFTSASVLLIFSGSRKGF